MLKRNILSFVSRYLRAANAKKSILCVGLDPTPEHVPPQFHTDDAISDIKGYLQRVINLAATRVPVVKPQYAYYGAFGPEGIQMLIDLVSYAHERELLVILDGKRADIDETMEQYGEEVFGEYGVDACTFVPYLGPTFLPSDVSVGWLPWFKKGRMAISMVRTSNKGAALLQDAKLENGLLVYEQMAIWAKEWNAQVQDLTDGAGCVGDVVGATWPEQAPTCRKYAGDEVFSLIPGYGPGQGGGADGAVGGLPNSLGELMGTVNNSRGSTLYSWRDKKTREPKKGDPMDLVAGAIDAANIDLNGALERKLGKTADEIYAFAA